MIERNKRALEKLSYRYWLKDKSRSPEQNYVLAQKLLNYIDKRKSLMKRLLQ